MSKSRSFQLIAARLEQALEEVRRGSTGTPTVSLTTREDSEPLRAPPTPHSTTVPETPLDVKTLYQCVTQYDRGDVDADYEDEVHYVSEAVVTPLDIDSLDLVNFLCNRSFYNEVQQKPRDAPMEWCTTDNELTAVTMKKVMCPFIVQDSPSDYRDIITIVLDRDDLESLYNGIRCGHLSMGSSP